MADIPTRSSPRFAANLASAADAISSRRSPRFLAATTSEAAAPKVKSKPKDSSTKLAARVSPVLAARKSPRIAATPSPALSVGEAEYHALKAARPSSIKTTYGRAGPERQARPPRQPASIQAEPRKQAERDSDTNIGVRMSPRLVERAGARTSPRLVEQRETKLQTAVPKRATRRANTGRSIPSTIDSGLPRAHQRSSGSDTRPTRIIPSKQVGHRKIQAKRARPAIVGRTALSALGPKAARWRKASKLAVAASESSRQAPVDVSALVNGGHSVAPSRASDLYRALCNGSVDDVSSLLKSRADPSSVALANGQTVVFLAAARASGALEICKLLVRLKADAATEDLSLRQTALYYAVRPTGGGVDCAEYLIDQRCDPDHIDDSERSPLFYAAQHGDSRCAELLIARGANLNRADSDGFTPCFTATQFPSALPTLRALLLAGADVHHVCAGGQTPLYHARAAGAVRLLLAHRANPAHKDPCRRTPVFFVARASACEAVQALLDAKAPISAKDYTGKTCHDFAPSDEMRLLLKANSERRRALRSRTSGDEVAAASRGDDEDGAEEDAAFLAKKRAKKGLSTSDH